MDPYVDQHRPFSVTIPVEQSTSPPTPIGTGAQGQDTDSDVLWALPRNCGENPCGRCGKCKMRRKKCKKRGSSSMVHPTPSTADFHVTVAQNTGFSPLSPTAPLQDVFNATMSTTGERSTLRKEVGNEGILSPTPPANPFSFLGTHAEPSSVFSVVGDQPSAFSSPSAGTPPPTSPAVISIPFLPSPVETQPSDFLSHAVGTPARLLPTFEELRPQLFQRAFVDSVNGVKFNDTHIYVYSARTRSGVAHRPLAVHARSAFLNAASSTFEQEITPSSLLSTPPRATRKADRVQYGYNNDSDLEDCDEDVTDPHPTVPVRVTSEARVAESKSEHLNHVPIAQEAAVEMRGEQQERLHLEEAATPRSVVMNVSEFDLMSLDGSESDGSLDELLKDAQEDEKGDSISSPLLFPDKPTLLVVLNEDDTGSTRRPPSVKHLPLAQQKQPHNFASNSIPKDVSVPSSISIPKDSSLDNDSVLVEETAKHIPHTATRERIIFIQDSAHRTWKALLLYLYNDHLEFSQLRSTKIKNGDASPPNAIECSPKSMYRLADKLGLEKLKEKAASAVKERLTRDNIVDEMFSDFAWRYPDVLRTETEFFYSHSSDSVVQSRMSEIFQDIAYGQLPHSSVVLDALFKRFVAATK